MFHSYKSPPLMEEKYFGELQKEEDRATDQISIFTSDHGRMRRSQRDIGIHDLQSAIKYGLKEPAFPCRRTGRRRWKYTYKHVVYITDEHSKMEITSFIEPLGVPDYKVSDLEQLQHSRMADRLCRHPEEITSHTVFIVDLSKSMSTSDIPEFRHRADAVFCCIATEFIEEQIFSGQARLTDVLTLIEMRETPEVVFSAEPLSKVSFNMVLRRRSETKPRGHGNYGPSLELAEEILSKHKEFPHCALLLAFLSDGKPSDHVGTGFGDAALKHKIMLAPYIKRIAQSFTNQLFVQMYGFSNSPGAFEVMQYLANRAIDSGSDAEFHNCTMMRSSLAKSFTKLSSRLTQTRTALTTLGGEGKRTLRNFTSLKMTSISVMEDLVGVCTQMLNCCPGRKRKRNGIGKKCHFSIPKLQQLQFVMVFMEKELKELCSFCRRLTMPIMCQDLWANLWQQKKAYLWKTNT
jgi:hypothetical protein